jgi:ribonuclease P/MRP protein subunit RPP40
VALRVGIASENPCKLYADDTKIIAKAVSYEDKENLQSDINYLVLWCNTWLMSLNVDKCKIMHICKSNTQHTYTMDTNNGQTNVLAKTAIERDLGVIISADKILGMMNKTFNHMSVDLMKIIYTTYVRPHLEFAVCMLSVREARH